MSAGSEARSPRHELALDLPAAHTGVRVARNVIRQFTRLLGTKDSEVDTLVLVASELLANTIDHGQAAAAMTEHEIAGDVRMRLSLVIENGRWTMSVIDEGGGDPDAVLRALAAPGLPDLEDERGRGLFLLREMVDSLEVVRSADGRGLCVTATRKHAGR